MSLYDPPIPLGGHRTGSASPEVLISQCLVQGRIWLLLTMGLIRSDLGCLFVFHD